MRNAIYSAVVFLILYPVCSGAASWDGIVVMVSENQVMVEMEEAGSVAGDHFRLVHITSSGMEIEAGVWKIVSMEDRKAKAVAVSQKLTPRKGMKAFLTPPEIKTAEKNDAGADSKGDNGNFGGLAEDSLAYRAETGDMEAQVQLGYQYLSKNDYKSAYHWIERAAVLNVPSGLRGMGWLYQNGFGVSKDMKTALEYYQRAADRNFSPAQNDLGWIYLNGIEVKKNVPAAVTYFSAAADNGFALAQDNLASIYLNGNGVKKDYQKALEWYQKSAEQNHANAQNSLGFMYYNGFGVSRDAAMALHWYKKAAENGNSMAQYNLADMLFHGVGTQVNKEQAVFWLKRSAQNGNLSAQDKLIDLGINP